MTMSPYAHAQNKHMRIVLGVCGSVAAYKACGLVSTLVQRGDEVEVILTADAQRFVAPLSFAALTRRPVASDLWDQQVALQHIDLVRRADLLVIAPATAHMIAKLALGLADDLLSTAALAATIPMVLAPAMNSAMYEHPATQAHLATLRGRGVRIVEPGSGFLAEREQGVGRLAEQADIIQMIDAALQPVPTTRLSRVLITAGPTREPLDPVRFISNAATGETGIALARVAKERGAHVRLLLGPTSLPVPAGIDVVRVTTAAQMWDAALSAVEFAPELVVATAAVADHRPREISAHKLKKGRDSFDLVEFVPTEDIVLGLRQALPDAFVVGFAAETEEHQIHATRKLVAKNLDAIVVNDVRDGRGFGPVVNHAVVHFADGASVDFGPLPKMTFAQRFLDVLEEHI